MRDEMESRIMRATERIRERDKLRAKLAESQRILARDQERLSAAEEVLQREQAGVEKLEGTTLTNLFASMLGTKEHRLEKERREAVAAGLKHDECVRAVNAATGHLRELRGRLDELDDAEAEYDRVLQEKAKLMADSNDRQAVRLVEFSEELAGLEADRKELREAVDVGDFAKRALERTQTDLKAAAGLGTWDMLGGGMMVTALKRSRIGDAKQNAEVAQEYLRRFREELADASRRLDVSLGEMDGFLSFADYFFDGLITDWVVQSQLRNASEACQNAIDHVSRVLDDCERAFQETDERIQQVDAERREFITKG